MITAGVDEAGRGPVIGPMVMAIVAVDGKQKAHLNKIGVKDSKLLTPQKRNKLARLIKQHIPHVIIKVPPSEIDKHVTSQTSSLNLLEAITTAKLINRLLKKTKANEVFIDLPAKNKEDYVNAIKAKLENKDIKLTAEFKADLNHVEAAAASILAKVTRDKSLETIKKKLNYNFGSGYPADPNTVKALQEKYDLLKENNLLRLSWKTVHELEEAKKQSTLTSF